MGNSMKKSLVILALSLAMTTITAAAAPASWEVEKGQSLSRIVRQLLPDDRGSRAALMQAIVDLNPHAFRNADPSLMYAGVTLTLPDDAQVARVAKTIKSARAPSDAENKLAARKARTAQVAATAAESSNQAAGRVVFAKGQTTAATRGGNVRALSKGEEIYDGDTLNTGPGSYMRLLYSDGATMVLRPRTRLQLEEYKHSGDGASDRNLMRLVKGGFRTVTGAIGQANKENYLVATPVATIGIRGTDYSAVFCAGDCVNMPDGLYTTTDAGSTVVTSAGQSEIVDTGASVFVPIVGGAPQQLRIKPRVLSLPEPGCD